MLYVEQIRPWHLGKRPVPGKVNPKEKSYEKFNKAIVVPGSLILALVTTACGTVGGAAVGAGAGAAVGAGTGYGADRGALIGTGIGAAAGAIYDVTK